MKLHTVLTLFASSRDSYEDHNVKVFTEEDRDKAIQFAVASFMDFQNDNQELFEQGWMYDRTRTECKGWDVEQVINHFIQDRSLITMSFENEEYEVWTVELSSHEV